MEKENAIEVRNMTKSFKIYKDQAKTIKDRLVRAGSKPEIKTVLEDINLDIHKGETVALIGTNGSGKSTLLKLMTKILYPNKGTVSTQGKLTSLLELGAGFHMDFTGRENIYFNASVFGLTRKEIDKRIDRIIEFSELGPNIDEPVRTYSSGMYMRLAFSIAINVDADILLVDEILAVGDQHFQNKCFEKLEELRDSDKTIVIVSHSLDTVQNLCSRAIWVYHGRIQLDGDPAYVIRQYLKQSALDNEENFSKNDGEESHKHAGVIHIDTPHNFESIKAKQILNVSGWAVSTSKKETIEIGFDQSMNPVEKQIARPDVYEVYEEEYAGLIKDDILGFNIQIMVPEDISGDARLTAVLKADGRIIDRKKVRLRVEE
ncbi:ABC transporter ATP-binding protein [Ileibacterium valens]|uniref:ABC transporter domain-containing protein n=1 Tax=Ileibacterium valens TaxID=1862668 RepID=A0A1U7NDS3_9FIRM|nr:ABC transporter ATP-binding protein [Ileibacterium valens]OLU37506.1 hypothetical protein BO222_10385 [Ileibacterium valens]OLU39354.1 hypothetical protein BM735_07480 [Erysipelotrichaceae bacterium NYU-BL-F16]OLU42059.1 hypothetical protein BO224_02400 [Erysipelotrichaceae bacterium NYU-BL-E8]